MNRIKNYGKLATSISEWLNDYLNTNQLKCFVIGVSGGIDSAVVSTLCAEAGKTIIVNMPIYQKVEQMSLASDHGNWLRATYPGTLELKLGLTQLYDTFMDSLEEITEFNAISPLALANTRARLRMTTLYHISACTKGLVVGTGNKVEDFGVGFFTKYGDGGVDISPIADLYKTEVWELGRYLGLNKDIISAAPTDGLWDDGRTDEDQLGLDYPTLESIMEVFENNKDFSESNINKYLQYRKNNLHKMQAIPIYKLSNLKD